MGQEFGGSPWARCPGGRLRDSERAGAVCRLLPASGRVRCLGPSPGLDRAALPEPRPLSCDLRSVPQSPPGTAPPIHGRNRTPPWGVSHPTESVGGALLLGNAPATLSICFFQRPPDRAVSGHIPEGLPGRRDPLGRGSATGPRRHRQEELRSPARLTVRPAARGPFLS